MPFLLVFIIWFIMNMTGLLYTVIDEDRTRYFPTTVELLDEYPDKEKVWVFIFAGQSNMAGRGLVEPEDTIPHERILTITPEGKLALAKEPLHFYEPNRTGLDCGLSFGRTLIQHVPDSVHLLLIPTAVGASSLSHWIEDRTHRGVSLLSNFKEKVALGKELGTIKAIIWHQGESDSSDERRPMYKARLEQLFTMFRDIVEKDDLPIIMGELGLHSFKEQERSRVNQKMHEFASRDLFTSVIHTTDLDDKGDRIHFNSEGIRIMGQRFADRFLDMMYE